MLTLEKQSTGAATNIETPLRRVSELVQKRGLIVIVSDFLTPLTTLEKSLGQLRAWGHEIACFQTLDPTEINLTFEKASLFRDIESGQELYIDPKLGRILGRYQKRERLQRWIYHGLHSLDFSFWYYSRPAWDIGVIVLCAGGAVLSVIGVVISIRRLRRDVRRIASRKAL